MAVELYWLPLGAGPGNAVVRASGRAFEALVARRQHRPRRDLYHSALVVSLDGARYVIEMAPVWRTVAADRGVVSEGPVGSPWLGRSRWFRYEVRCWRDGVLPDIAYAVASPQLVSGDPAVARRVLDLVALFPCGVWGRDDFHTGEMWNSNSLTAWLLAASGHDAGAIRLPAGGRAPGWSAGWEIACRSVDLMSCVNR